MSAYKLTFMSGKRDGETVEISLQENVSEITMGRSEDCKVSIPEDPELSRHHAKLVCMGNEGWKLEDLGSTNGTYIGEFKQTKRISLPATIQYGEIFRIGRTCFRLEIPTEDGLEAYAKAYLKLNA